MHNSAAFAAPARSPVLPADPIDQLLSVSADACAHSALLRAQSAAQSAQSATVRAHSREVREAAIRLRQRADATWRVQHWVPRLSITSVMQPATA